jgi:hypothetical protein
MSGPAPDTAFPARPHAGARVALLTPYFTLFDGVFPHEYRERQESNARRLAELIGGEGFEVHHLGLTDSEDLAIEHGRRLAAAEPHVLVVAPVMAAPATLSVPVAEIVDRPTVVCQVARRAVIGADYDEIDATEGSTLLGAIMACAGLRKAGSRFAHVLLSDGPSLERLTRTLSGGIAVAALAGKRIGLIGSTLEGYVDVELSEDELGALGLTGIELAGKDLQALFESADVRAVARARDELITDGGLTLEADEQAFERDLRLTVALGQLATEHGLDAIALNCHGEVFRRSPLIGTPACLAGSVLASSECPVTCTGDVSTIVASLVAQQFTPKVLYCEPYAFEYSSGSVVLGSCGIGNVRVAASSHRPRVCTNYAYPGRLSPGTCLRFGLEPGAGTLLAYAPRAKAGGSLETLLWMTGELTGTYHPGMHGPNAVMLPHGDDPLSSWAEWSIAGPAHHVALAAADLTIELETMNEFSSVGIRRVPA